MSTEDTELKRLSDFFRAHFHQDWMCDDATPADVVARYLQAATTQEISALREAIVRYVESQGDDLELEKKLFFELGCFYLPSADGLSVREWLLNVASLLQGGSNR